MPRVFGKLRSFWSEDRALTVLLVALVLVAFVIAPLGLVGQVGEVVLAVAVSLLLVTGVLTVVKKRRAGLMAGLLALANFVVEWLVVWHPSRGLRFSRGILFILFLSLLTTIVFARVFRSGRITVHRVVGAVAAYLLLGFIWSQLYILVELLQPAAFQLATGTPLDHQQFIYFSFVTMTTVGYGDITPVHPVARSLANLEALIGQLYPAILIARLVSLEITSTGSEAKTS